MNRQAPMPIGLGKYGGVGGGSDDRKPHPEKP